MRGTMLDFSSWSAALTTLFSVLLITLLMVGLRLLFMQTIQKRRERENRQINERLRTLIAAYKVLGGSFTGELRVNPIHLREMRAAPEVVQKSDGEEGSAEAEPPVFEPASERHRRVRDAVEAALSDIILLGTEEQVAMAARAAQDMVDGKHIHTAELVVSLRHFIRNALDLEEIPASIVIPNQGPTRTGGAGAGGARRPDGGSAGGTGGGRSGGGGGGGAGMGMGGGALGMGAVAGSRRSSTDDSLN